MNTQKKQPSNSKRSPKKRAKRDNDEAEDAKHDWVSNNYAPQLVLETVTCRKIESLRMDDDESPKGESNDFVSRSKGPTRFVVDELIFDSTNDSSNSFETDNDRTVDGGAKKKRSVEFLHCTNSIVVVLPKSTTLYFHGLMNVRVLHGAVEVLGYILADFEEQELYSPRGSSYLYLTNANREDRVEKSRIRKALLSANVDLDEIESLYNKIDSASAVLLCRKIDSPTVNFLTSHIAQKIFPISDSVHVDFNVDETHSNLLKINPELDSIILRMDGNTRTLLSGGKGVGKSTAVRYIINKLLLNYKEVLVIDLDPGQPEFTIPGCISATTVTEPVLGPNYTHLREPYRSIFVSNIDISAKPHDYIKSVELLVSLCNRFTSVPTIINYMGYTRGFGLNIFCSVVGTVNPSSIIEIRSSNPAQNFESPLSRNLIYQSALTLTPGLKKLKNFEIVTIPSMTDKTIGWSLEPRKIREMCVLCYFGKTLSGTQKYITDVTSHTYNCRVDFSAVNLMRDGQIVTPAVVNANLVAMCGSSSREGSYLCYGWGIVRAVDFESKQLYIITPIKGDNLELVDSLILGSVALPPSMYMSTRCVEGVVPYVSKGILPVFGKLTKRSHLPKDHF